MGDFFSFKKMITPFLIKFLYVLGAIAIIPAAIFAFDMFKYDMVIAILTAVGVLIGGELLWRIFCEYTILFFSMYETMVAMKKQPPVNSNATASNALPQRTIVKK